MHMLHGVECDCYKTTNPNSDENLLWTSPGTVYTPSDRGNQMSVTRISSVLAPEVWRFKCSWCLRTGNLTSTNVFYALSNRAALSHYLGPQMAFGSPNGHHCMVLRNPFQENNLIGTFSLFLKMFFYHTLLLFHKVMDTICWVPSVQLYPFLVVSRKQEK